MAHPAAGRRGASDVVLPIPDFALGLVTSVAVALLQTLDQCLAVPLDASDVFVG
jgi:hypothetical protein